MKTQIKLTHEYVDYIPDEIMEGRVYVCLQFSTAVHKCCCGCGREVVTPLSPTGWKLISHGRTISLHPSIGNWSFPCQSHYWIKRNQVVWAKQHTQAEIQYGRAQDKLAKAAFYSDRSNTAGVTTSANDGKMGQHKKPESLWAKFKKWLS